MGSLAPEIDSKKDEIHILVTGFGVRVVIFTILSSLC